MRRMLMGTALVLGFIALAGSLAYAAIRSGGWLTWAGWLGVWSIAGILVTLLPRWILRIDTPHNALLSPEASVSARATNRDTIVKALGGAFLLAGLFFTWQQQQTTNESLQVDRQRQESERFTDAVGMLSATNATLDARLGGIYTLAQLAKDSASGIRPYVVQVISAYVREHARSAGSSTPVPLRPSVPPDIQAAVSALGENPWGGAYDLTDADLSGADLRGVSLVNSVLVGADLSWADLSGADLSGADLSRADLQGRTILTNANLAGARLDATHLESTDLTSVAPTLTADQLVQSYMNSSTIMSPNLTRAVTNAMARSKTVPSGPPQVTITQPTTDAVVPLQPDINGTIRQLPPDRHLWLVTYGPTDAADPLYYPQGVSFPDFRSGVNVQGIAWSLRRTENSYTVGSAKDFGKRFEILVVAADQASNERFIEYLRFGVRFANDFRGLNYLPSGASVVAKVAVSRLPDG